MTDRFFSPGERVALLPIQHHLKSSVFIGTVIPREESQLGKDLPYRIPVRGDDGRIFYYPPAQIQNLAEWEFTQALKGKL